MPTRAGKRMRNRSITRHRPGQTTHYNTLISEKLDELESSLQRIKKGSPRHSRLAAKAKSRVGVSTIKDSLQNANFHDLLEKAADATSRWQKTAGMVSIIGNNVKGMASPILSGIKGASPIAKIASTMAGMGRGAGPMGAFGSSAASGARAAMSEGGGGGMDLNNMVQSVLSSLSGGGNQE